MVLRLRAEPDLWTLLIPPIVWGGHFLFCYVAGAVACAKAQTLLPDLAGFRIAVLVATLLALGLIALGGVQAWRHWGLSDGDPPHDRPSDGDRNGFLGLATLLLSALSAVGVAMVAMPALLIGDCR
jgi:hypothetical protein